MRCRWLIVLGLLSASAPAAAQDEQTAEIAEEEEAALPPPAAPPSVAFHQILAAPRIGDRLSALAVDPSDPDRIYVGTEEGTVVRSTDGGITWEESQLTAFNVLARSVGGPVGVIPTPSLDFGRDDAFDISRLGREPIMDRRLRSGAYAIEGGRAFGIDPEPPGAPLDLPVPPISSTALLQASLTSRASETVNIQRMEVCPGGRYPLLVATIYELYGSDDGGRTFVRLFQGSSSSPFVGDGAPQVTSVACSPANPDDVVVTTSRGVHRSTDGGLTFTDQVSGVSAGLATAVAWDLPSDDPTHSPALLVAMDTLLFVGDPDSPGGLSYIYPDFNNPGLAPFFSINWVATTPSAQIWIGTRFGPRASLDGGLTWQRVGGIVLTSESIEQVVVGWGHGQRERVALVADRFVYTTEDNGETIFPFFIGLSRRTVRRVAAGGLDDNGEGVWFVLTTGELWRTGGGEPVPALDPRPFRRWARSRLAVTPPLEQVLRVVFELHAVTANDVEEIWVDTRRRELLPVIGLEASFGMGRPRSQRAHTPILFDLDRRGATNAFSVFLTATWSLPDLYWPDRIEWPKAELYELQQQIGFLIEDAWHERRMHLTRLSRDGYADELQAETLRARVEVLEALLEVWIGGPLESVREGTW